MAQHDVVLPVVHEQQQQFFYCGPACINMVLSRWGQSRPQLDVWQDVQDNTGSMKPSDAPSDAGSFDEQYCDLCSSKVITNPDGTTHGDYACWYTTPEAMAATLNISSPVPMKSDYIADGSEAIRRLAESLTTFDAPAVFTTMPALHWLVAYGYRYDDVPPTATSFVKWNSQYVTGIFVHNSATAAVSGGTATVQMITPRGLDDLLMSIECGARAGEYPVVGGAAKNGGGGGGGNSGAGTVIGPWAEFVAAVFVWLDPRRWLRYLFRPRRPGPPPR